MGSSAFRVEVTQKATEDLRVALAYYMRVAGRASAEKFLQRYDEIIAYLEDVPTIATKVGHTDLFWLQMRNHVLVYSVDEPASTVYVMRIHYGSSNWREIAGGGAHAQ